jgi:sterol desaturase/sphingolipid hydroxylase (fatty acid hydroxylase superfamily)
MVRRPQEWGPAERFRCGDHDDRPVVHLDVAGIRRGDAGAVGEHPVGPELAGHRTANAGSGTDADEHAGDLTAVAASDHHTDHPTAYDDHDDGRRVRLLSVKGLGVAAPARVWVLLVVTAGLVVAGWRALSAQPGGAPRAMWAEGVVLVGPAVLVLVLAVLAVERLWPAERRPLGAAGHRQDLAYLALYALVAVPALTLIGTGAAVTLSRIDGGFTLHPLDGLPRWALVVTVLVLMDGANWTSHWLNHRVQTFWRFHALHHSQEEMSILTSFRAHPVVHTSFQLAALPLIVLGTGGAVPAWVLIGYIVLSTLPHANVNWRLGPLRYVLVTPAYHRLHHDRADVRGVNLGTVLVLWDVLAGLAVFPERGTVPVPTGLGGRPLPVEQAVVGEGRAAWVRVMARQLASPIRGNGVSDPVVVRPGPLRPSVRPVLRPMLQPALVKVRVSRHE